MFIESLIIELLDDFFAETIVKEIEVIIKAVAISQVKRVSAEAADRPDTKPLLLPPIPSPPPSDLCNRTNPTRTNIFHLS